MKFFLRLFFIFSIFNLMILGKNHAKPNKDSFEIDGSFFSENTAVIYIDLKQNRNDIKSSKPNYLKALVEYKFRNSTSRQEGFYVSEEMVEDFLNSYSDQEILDMIGNPFFEGVPDKHEGMRERLSRELISARFFMMKNLDQAISYLKDTLEINSESSKIIPSSKHFQNILNTVAMIGANHTYDEQRAIDGDMGENLDRDISMNEMFEANKIGYFGFKNPEELSSGVCRDIAPFQGYILNKLGVNKENGFRVFVKGYIGNTYGHANLFINYNKDGRQFNHIINYGDQLTKEVFSGNNLSSIVEDHESENDTIIFKLYEISDNGKFENTALVPSEFGKTLYDLLGGELDDISPKDSISKNRIIFKTHNPSIDIDFKVYAGQLKPQLRSKNQGFTPPEIYTGLTVNKHFSYEKENFFEADSLVSFALTYRNKKNPVNQNTVSFNEDGAFISLGEIDNETHNLHISTLMQHQGKLKLDFNSIKTQVGAKFIALADGYTRDDSIEFLKFKQVNGDFLMSLNTFLEVSYLQNHHQANSDYIKTMINSSTAIDYKDVQYYGFKNIQPYFHHLSLSIEGRKKLAQTKLGILYLKALGSVIFDKITPSTHSEVSIGLTDHRNHHVLISSKLGGRINKNDPNLKMSTNRSLENIFSFAKIGEQTQTSLQIGVITPLEYSPYGTEFHSTFRYDF